MRARNATTGRRLSWAGVVGSAEVMHSVASETNPTPAPEGIMRRSPSHFLISVACATLAFSLFPTATQAQITLSGLPFIQGPTTNGAGLVSPVAIGATVTPDGFKVTGIDLSYTTPGGELGKSVDVSWVGTEALSTGPPGSPINFTDHLDGSLTYDGGFALTDVTLRTITADTDYDLTTLHLGAFPSGVPFDASITSPWHTQPAGPDQLIQFFQMDFVILTNSVDKITLHLPDSVASSLSTPEPSSIWLLVAGISLAMVGSGFGRRFLERSRPAVTGA
jgi:hypothetical protein